MEVRLTRSNLEMAMLRWARKYEGPIAEEYVQGMLGDGQVLEALDCVSVSLHSKQLINLASADDDTFLIWTAWENYTRSGSPGFTLSPSVIRF